MGAGVQSITAVGGLSARRVLIIRLLAGGKRPAEIASILGLARDSVYEHLQESRKAMHVRTNCELVALVAKLGLISPP